MKRKRLLLAVALVTGMLGWNSAQAQEDITSQYLTNADLSTENSGWTYYSNDYKYQAWRTGSETLSAAVEFYAGWGSLEHTNFKFSQTPTLPAGDYRIAVNAFFREGNDGNGTNNGKAWIFAGDKKQNVTGLQSGGLNAWGSAGDDMNKAMAAFHDGNFSNAFDFSLSEETAIEIGFEGKFDAIRQWCILGPVKLYKYSLDDYLVDYRTKVAEAEALYDSPMNGDVLSALQAAVVEESTFNLSSEVTAAIQTLTTAINNANASIAKYVAAQNTINETSAVIAKLDAAGQAAGNAELNTIQTAYNDRSLVEFTNAQANAIIVTAVKSQTTEGADMTLAIVNPSFENGFASGWTNNGMGIQNNDAFEKDGNNYAEKWQPNGTFSVKQSLTLLLAGVYQITAKTKARGVTSAKLFANGVEKSITVGDVTNTTVVEFACDANSTFEFGFEGVGTGAGNSWLCVDDFHMTYVGGLPDVTAVEGKMNADVAAAQTSAISTYNGNKTVANYNAAVAAVAAAQASVDAYTSAAAAIADAKAIQDNHNFATAEAVTTFAKAIAAIETPYNGNSLTTEAAAAAATTLGVSVSGWHQNADAAAVNYLENGFGLTDFNAALYINTWSTEGEEDGSNFKVPFYEYYTGNENSLGENTWTGTLTGLENGLYKVSAWVRVQAKAGVGVADATGITMNVNGGEAKDVTEGDVVEKYQFRLATYEAEGLVKDGTLKVNFNIAADNNIHWLSFKNVKYTKVRDLTPEEMAVTPTAIALYNDETEVTEAIELTATANTVTLTPVFTPEDATETVTWTSSDETVATVADGVVTGVAPGTATITVTSTLDENVSATATVNVSYPESTVPETVEIIDEEAMTKTIYTLSQTNLIKNGTFEYANAVSQWKTIGYTTDAVASNFTITANGGVNNSAYITTNGGGVGSEKTIRQSVAVESGKTYYFSVWTSGKAPSADNFKYNALFKMSDATTETGTLKEFEWPQGAGKTSSEWSQTESVFTAETGYVGVRMGWNESSNFDEFVLAEVISQEVIDLSATAEDYAALNEAIENVPTLGFLAEEAAPYNNVEAAAALAVAQSIDQSVKNLATTVQAATTALNSVTWNTNTEEVNAVYDGTFAGAENNGAPAGWTMSNNTLGGDLHSRAFVGDERLAEFNSTNSGLFIRFDGTNSDAGSMYYYGQTAGYTMPLKANTTYYVSADLAGWGSTGNNVRINVGGPEGFTGVGETNSMAVRADNANNEPIHVKFFFTTGDAGNYTISLQNPGASAKHNAVISNVEIMRVAPCDVTVTSAGKLGESYYATYSNADYALDFSAVEGIKAYYVTEASSSALTITEASKVPAGTAVLIEGAEAKTYQVPVVTSGTDDASNNRLLVSNGNVLGDGQTIYVLGNGKNGVGFYLKKKDSAIAAGKAYLEIEDDGTGETKSFISLCGDDATAISNVEAAQGTGIIYNLNGQRVAAPVKGGLYIMNGKKVLVK